MKSLFALLISTFITLCLAELGLRVIYPDGISPPRGADTWKWIESGPLVAWQNKAGFEQKQRNLFINSDNFRGPEINREPGDDVVRIVCLGDSRTFGIWSKAGKVRADNAYPAYLQQFFDQNGQRVEVINAGVVGYTSAHGLRQLVTKVVELEPDVIIASFGINDAAASWDPSLRDLEPESDLRRALLYGLIDYRLFQLLRQAYFKVPGTLPEAWDVPWTTPEQFRRHMQRIAEVGADAGAKVLFLNQALRDISRGPSKVMPGEEKTPIPTILGFNSLEHLHETYGVYQDIVLDLADENGVALVDGAADFATHQGDPLFSDYDLVHVNDLGARRHAQLIHDEILARGWID